jgi:hypothetical protein
MGDAAISFEPQHFPCRMRYSGQHRLRANTSAGQLMLHRRIGGQSQFSEHPRLPTAQLAAAAMDGGSGAVPT